MATIVPPNDFTYSSYVTDRDLRDFSASGFFGFQDFPSKEQIEKQVRHLEVMEDHARHQTVIAARKVDFDTEKLVKKIIAGGLGSTQSSSVKPSVLPFVPMSAHPSEVPEAELYVDPSSFTVHKYIFNEHCGPDLPLVSGAVTKTVNNFDLSASLENISHFVAMNYILITTEELEGIPTEVLEDIRHRFVGNATRLDNPTAEMCGRLDQQFALGDDIHDDTEEPDLRRIVVLKFVIDWANSEAHGSKKRRGHGYRPEAVLIHNGGQIGFLEVKPPGSCHTVREYLHDLWNLANCAKDAIDNFLQQGLSITKMFLNTIDTNLLPRTPPMIEYDEESVQPNCGRPSKITPIKRRNMF
ncbi:hypothetical protein BGZ47_000344 [Haplosporangium gracile]|nr:hypothetical protein BGZ47_000344 [Haplosporangium gracile]